MNSQNAQKSSPLKKQESTELKNPLLSSSTAPPSPAQSYFNRKIKQPFLTALKTGITLHSLTLSVSLGLTIGIFPVLGTSTIWCLLAVWWFQLNIVLVQTVNLVVTPLAIALSIPFLRLGEKLLGFPTLEISPSVLISSIVHDPVLALKAIACGVVGWGVCAVPVCVVSYILLRPILRMVLVRVGRKE